MPAKQQGGERHVRSVRFLSDPRKDSIASMSTISYACSNSSSLQSELERNIFFGATHEEALSRLLFLVEEQMRLGLLFGDSGTGKTLLLHQLRNEIHSNGGRAALVNLRGASPEQFYCKLLEVFCQEVPSEPTPGACWRLLTDKRRPPESEPTVLMLDDLHLAQRPVMTEIIRWMQWHDVSNIRRTLIPVVDRSFLKEMSRELVARVDLPIELTQWTFREMQFHLQQLGPHFLRVGPILTPEAIRRIYHWTQGNPRRVCRLAVRAIEEGKRRGHGYVPASLIDRIRSAELADLP